jgi:hypothetical protein
VARTHVQPHLTIGNVLARQVLVLHLLKNQMLCPTAPTARRIPQGNLRQGLINFGRATPFPASVNPRGISILIVAGNNSDFPSIPSISIRSGRTTSGRLNVLRRTIR